MTHPFALVTLHTPQTMMQPSAEQHLELLRTLRRLQFQELDGMRGATLLAELSVATESCAHSTAHAALSLLRESSVVKVSPAEQSCL